MNEQINKLTKSETNLNQDISDLNDIIDKLENISQFSDDIYYKINNSLAEINSRVDINDKKVEEYQNLKKSKSSNAVTRIDMALDIVSENFTILNKKTSLIDVYTKDIYERIEILGKSLTKQSQIMKKILNQSDK